MKCDPLRVNSIAFFFGRSWKATCVNGSQIPSNMAGRRSYVDKEFWSFGVTEREILRFGNAVTVGAILEHNINHQMLRVIRSSALAAKSVVGNRCMFLFVLNSNTRKLRQMSRIPKKSGYIASWLWI